jgi:hypothetical protein
LRYGRTAPPWHEVESELAKLWRDGPFSSNKRWEDVRDTICDAFSITDEAIKRLIEGESIQYDEWTQM